MEAKHPHQMIGLVYVARKNYCCVREAEALSHSSLICSALLVLLGHCSLAGMQVAILGAATLQAFAGESF